MSTETDTEILQGLDFAIPCELDTHGHDVEDRKGHTATGPAVYIESGTCPKCGTGWVAFVCQGRRDSMAEHKSRNLIHASCGKSPGADYRIEWARIQTPGGQL